MHSIEQYMQLSEKIHVHHCTCTCVCSTLCVNGSVQACADLDCAWEKPQPKNETLKKSSDYMYMHTPEYTCLTKSKRSATVLIVYAYQLLYMKRSF